MILIEQSFLTYSPNSIYPVKSITYLNILCKQNQAESVKFHTILILLVIIFREK